VAGDKTSGEVDFVLLCRRDKVYVGAGSDHTGRDLEPVNVIKSKRLCRNIMAQRVWNLKEVKKDWDEIILRSWVRDDGGEEILYQEAPLAAIMPPLRLVKNALDEQNLDGVAVFSGTIPILPGKIHYSSYFAVELENPKPRWKLPCDYRVNVLDYLKGLRG
jgi:hypothetical protein